MADFREITARQRISGGHPIDVLHPDLGIYTSNSKTKLPSSDGFPISVGYNVDFESRFKYEQILLGQILTLPPKPTGFLMYKRWISGGYPIGLWARNKGEKYQNPYNSHQIILDQLQKYSPPTISAKL